jgi:hypothetical protein
MSCGEKNTSEGKMEKGTMEYFIKTLDLKATGKYRDILIERKHKTDRIAPDAVRGFIEEIEITRFAFKQGAKFENEKATLWWFVSEFGAKGKPGNVIAEIKKVFEAQGFTALDPVEDEHGWKEFSFVKETDEMQFVIKTKELEPFVGSKEPMCGGDIIFDIAYRKPVQPSTVSGMIKLYPQIACPELPAEVLNYVNEHKIVHMSYGGTWERYYTWSVAISAEDEKAAENMLGDVEEIIGGLGYSLWKEEGGIKTYQRQGSGGETPSFMDLEIDKGSIFMLRFQPRS